METMWLWLAQVLDRPGPKISTDLDASDDPKFSRNIYTVARTPLTLVCLIMLPYI